jgi:hypothetical protein
MNSTEVSALIRERNQLFERIAEINTILQKNEEDKRKNRMDEILKNPIDNEPYMHTVREFDIFQRVLGDTLFSISSQLGDNCVDTIAHRILYDYNSRHYKSTREFKEWLDDCICDTIRDFSRKSDAEEYYFHHRCKIHEFLGEKNNMNEWTLFYKNVANSLNEQ